MVKAEVVHNKTNKSRRSTNYTGILYPLLGLFFLIIGISFIWNLAWEFIKFGIGLILILLGLAFMGFRKIIRIRV